VETTLAPAATGRGFEASPPSPPQPDSRIAATLARPMILFIFIFFLSSEK
jgi:hypothetical protein